MLERYNKLEKNCRIVKNINLDLENGNRCLQ